MKNDEKEKKEGKKNSGGAAHIQKKNIPTHTHTNLHLKVT